VKQLLFTLLLLLKSVYALAEVDELIGVRMSAYGSASLIASPPLPPLWISKSTRNLKVEIGYLDGKFVDVSPVDDAFTNSLVKWEGSFSGFGASSSYTYGIGSVFGWYTMVFGNVLSGDLQLVSKADGTIIGDSDGNQIVFNGIKGSSFYLNSGLAVSLIGNNSKDLISAGIFVGPIIGVLKSEIDFDNIKSNSNIFTYGLFSGLQLGIRIGGIVLNPFIVQHEESSDQCKGYSISDGSTIPGEGACAQKGDNIVDMDTSFLSYGLNILILKWKLTLGLYGRATKDVSIEGAEVAVYKASISFGKDM